MKKLVFLSLLSCVLSGAVAGVAFAAPVTSTINTNIQVIAPLSISAGTPMNLGKVAKPSSGTQSYTLNTNGTITPGSPAASVVSASAVAGNHTITGSNSTNYKVTLTAGGAGVSGITITALRGDIASGGTCAGLPCNITGQSSATLSTGATLTVGAAVSIDSTVVAGNYNTGQLQYTISVDYE